ncbi:YlqD family protein [Massilibacterium senegalense]|uniref:YlqD family protein n=1 Tax=Massilibacterium senegalense TaxID=1632858 RepID=UPI00078114C7|nr:YlqD family protein [Massilibacterium senegalense]
MKILVEAVIKQVITEKSKQTLMDRIHAQIVQFEKECEQLQFERKRLEKQYKHYEQTVDEKFQKEINKRKQKQSLLQTQLGQIAMLSDGSEIEDGVVQSVVDVQVGDSVTKLQKQKEIVIKDGVIIEIR